MMPFSYGVEAGTHFPPGAGPPLFFGLGHAELLTESVGWGTGVTLHVQNQAFQNQAFTL